MAAQSSNVSTSASERRPVGGGVGPGWGRPTRSTICGWSGQSVRISFDVLSYAGVLTITAVADPDALPELPGLAAALRTELATLAATPVGS